MRARVSWNVWVLPVKLPPVSDLYDIIIIGGGINGCSLARHAAEQGFRVALLEKDDFGAGVTSRSTRLIHGGLRYLESFQFGVVKESLHDRRAWLDEFPGIVDPQPFVIPVYKEDSRPAWYIHTGLKLYGMLSRDAELGTCQRISADEVEHLEPGLDRKNLRAAFRYFDCQATYPEKLCVEMALRAETAGGTIRNHTAVSGFLREGSRVVGVKCGEEEFRGKLVVNAAGAWVDEVRTLLSPDYASHPLLSRLNGAHIVARPFPGAPQNAVYHEARSDKRPFFIVPWRRLYLIGTTETPYDGDPDRVMPTESEMGYLMTEFNQLFPHTSLKREDLCYAYAGSRPLVHANSSNMNKASRGHGVYDHEAEEGVGGLLSMVGGKLTTARSFAAETMKAAVAKLGIPDPGPLPVAPGRSYTADDRLAELYGGRARVIDRMIEQDPDTMMKPAAPGAPATVAEVLYAVQREKARTLGDILLRRTGLAYEADYDPDWPKAIAETIAGPLQWDSSATAQAVADFESELERTLIRL
jgi:glycerol-3-phosphate dehydrogenase